MTRTIMVIDDAESIRKSIGLILQFAGYDVIEARDGSDALGKLTGRPIDMFICDVNMPRMLTTESGIGMKAACREAGARAWIVKPFKPEDLLGAIKKLLV